MPNRCAWQRRPLVRLPPEGVAFAAQDDGATAVILAKAPPGTLNDDPSGLHPPALGGMFAVVGATLQVFSVVSRSAKLLLAQEPPTALHEQVHVALPSPLTTLRSDLVSPDRQSGRSLAEKPTAVQPAGASSQLNRAVQALS